MFEIILQKRIGPIIVIVSTTSRSVIIDNVKHATSPPISLCRYGALVPLRRGPSPPAFSDRARDNRLSRSCRTKGSSAHKRFRGKAVPRGFFLGGSGVNFTNREKVDELRKKKKCSTAYFSLNYRRKKAGRIPTVSGSPLLQVGHWVEGGGPYCISA